jgi:hypothetical protein
MTSLRFKITPRTIKSEYNWGLAIDISNRQRIGIAGHLRNGDLIQFENGKQYVVTELIRTSFEDEEVHGYQVHPHDYVGAITVLPPGECYTIVGASIQ